MIVLPGTVSNSLSIISSINDDIDEICGLIEFNARIKRLNVAAIVGQTFEIFFIAACTV